MIKLNPIRTYLDFRKIRKAKIYQKEQQLKKMNERKVAEGYPFLDAKEIKERAVKIVYRDEEMQTVPEFVQIIQDLRAGQKIRQEKELEQRRHELKEKEAYSRSDSGGWKR